MTPKPTNALASCPPSPPRLVVRPRLTSVGYLMGAGANLLLILFLMVVLGASPAARIGYFVAFLAGLFFFLSGAGGYGSRVASVIFGLLSASLFAGVAMSAGLFPGSMVLLAAVAQPTASILLFMPVSNSFFSEAAEARASVVGPGRGSPG